ncbi:MAG: DNA gyrase subunit A [Oscillospiraceae bacterium]|nr:DNA gyrase subunit A [Oscillospiraceae bacterium]
MLAEDKKVILTEINDEMKSSFLAYSMSVIIQRALPDVRDGLKPVHRRILYTMYEDGLTPDKKYLKCATTVGDCLGRYHPHGDASVYDALVRLAQSFSLRYPLVDGHGNFGSVDGDPPAAYRYTESKMAKIAVHMLTDIDKDTVDWQPNFDDRLKEPVVLPSRFPNILVNGSVGIAVGMATNIPPHNLREVINGVKLVAENPDCTLDELMEVIKGPDFPTGGIIMGKSGIRAAYATGRAKITLRSKTEIEEVNGRTSIIVTEIPYMVNKARLIESIAQLVKDKRVDGIHFIRDESDRTGMRIVIELKKDANPQIVLNKLFTYTQLQDTVGVIMLALVNGVPKVLTLKQILEEYLDFQTEVIVRRTKFDLKKTREREHILKGLVIALDFIDEVLQIIRSSQTASEAKQRLIERFGLSEIQAEYIANLRIIQLTGMERQKIYDELDAIEAKIKDFEDILANHQRVLDIIVSESEEIADKFGDDRRTEIQMVSGEVDIEDLIPEDTNVVALTAGGYIKRTSSSEYNVQKRGGRGVSGMKQREEDFVSQMLVCSTHDNILFITDKGIMYKLKTYELAEGGKSSRGTNIVNILPLTPGEDKITAMLQCEDFDDDKYVTMITKNGKIKRTHLSKYQNVRKSGLIAIGLDEGDEIRGVLMTGGHEDLLVATRNGMVIRFNEEKLRAMSRSAHGVRAIKLRDGDEVVSLQNVREDCDILTITDKGYGRRVKNDAYRLQNRGGYGIKGYKVTDEKGHVCGIRSVREDEDVILISTDGIIIRVRAADISVMGRYSTGVTIMRTKDSPDRYVAAFTTAQHDEEAVTEEVEQLSEEELLALATEEAKQEAEEEEELKAASEEPEDEEDETEE